MQTESISISIAAYNEEATLETLVLESLRVLAGLTRDYEVLIIDDGSRDRTGIIADQLARDHHPVRVVHHEKNLGFGPTLHEVYTLPSKELIFFIPGDGQISPSEIERLLPQVSHYEIILGWRHERRDTFLRQTLSHAYNILISVLLRKKVHDVDSVALVRRQAVHQLTFTSRSAFFHAELLLRMARNGFRWIEIPIAHRQRVSGRSKALRVGVFLPVLTDMIRFLLP